jgi:hypothetical protein
MPYEVVEHLPASKDSNIQLDEIIQLSNPNRQSGQTSV